MPLVTMPDGQVVMMPDVLTPELKARLQAKLAGGTPPVAKEMPPASDSSGVMSYLGDKLSQGTSAVKSAVEGVIEPAVTMATGLVAAPIGGFAGMAGDIYSGVTGGPRIGEEVASDVTKALTFQPRSQSAQKNLSIVGKAFEGSKLAGLPVVGQELAMLPKAAAMDLAYRGSKLGTSAQVQAGKIMQNALKPTATQVKSGDAAVAAQQLLERGISPNRAGVAELERRILQLQDEVANTIAGSQAQISKQKVLDRLMEVQGRFSNTVNPQADLAKIGQTGAGFATHPRIPGETLPIQLAQDIKKGTYRELSGKYGEMGSAEVEAQKALARGLKEEINLAEPRVSALNAEESALYKTLSVAERRLINDMNKDPVQLTGALRGMGSWGAFTANRSTAFKALLARMVYRAGKALKSGEGTPAPKVAPSNEMSLAPVGENILPPKPEAPMRQGRGLLSFADEQPKRTGAGLRSMPIVDYPIEPRLAPLYARGGVAAEIPTPKVAQNASLPSDLPPAVMPSMNAPSPLPVLQEANPLYRMKSIAEGSNGVTTPLPKLPPMGRGMLSLADDYRATPKQLDVESIPFKLRQEVLQNPEIVTATNAFIENAQTLRQAITMETNGFKKAQLEAQLRGLENRFAKGMRQLGIDNAVDALGLQKLYQSGGATNLPIVKSGRSGMLTGATQ